MECWSSGIVPVPGTAFGSEPASVVDGNATPVTNAQQSTRDQPQGYGPCCQKSQKVLSGFWVIVCIYEVVFIGGAVDRGITWEDALGAAVATIRASAGVEASAVATEGVNATLK